MKKVKFRIAAYTDAAGKVNPEAPRNGNEDNMYVRANLGCGENNYLFIADQEELLSDQGCLMVVADGMGGMNAGEVASEIAINVVRESFSDDTIPQSVFESTSSRTAFMESVIVNADEAIKAHAKFYPECDGMGSTIIMVWLYKGQITVSWCGDSRAYLYRDDEGLKQISKDHSYVQGLVDEGKITQDEAFNHPYGNVITISLGDPNVKAKPDSITVPVYKGDIILVNSDGLSGVLRDSDLESIIRNNRHDMSSCRQALWKAAQAAEWYDNVTVVLCEVTEGELYNSSVSKTHDNTETQYVSFRIKKSTLWMSLIVIGIIILGSAIFIRGIHIDEPQPQTGEELVPAVDSIFDQTKTIDKTRVKSIRGESLQDNETRGEDAQPMKNVRKKVSNQGSVEDSTDKKRRLTPVEGSGNSSNTENDDDSKVNRSHLTPAEQPADR